MKPNGEVTSWSNNQKEILTPEVALSHNQVVSNAGLFNQIPASGPDMQSMPLQNRPVFNTAQPSIPSQTRCKHGGGGFMFPPFFYYLHLQKTQFLFMYSYGSLVYSSYNGINKYDLNVILNSCINMRNVTTFDYNVC